MYRSHSTVMEKDDLSSMPTMISTPSLYLLLAIISVMIFLVYRGAYNRYAHSLSIFPGPFWGSVTDFHLANIISTVPTYTYEMHKQYGRIIPMPQQKAPPAFTNTLIKVASFALHQICCPLVIPSFFLSCIKDTPTRLPFIVPGFSKALPQCSKP